MNRLFFLHTHYIPQTILLECSITGAVLVPEFNQKLIPFYYGENKRFSSIEENLIYTSVKYSNIKLYFSFENLNVLSDYKQIPEYKRLGLSMLQLFHNNDNKYFNSKNGLTDDGYGLLRVMEKNNIILDLSHLNDFWTKEISRVFEGKIAVSHCVCNELFADKECRSNALSQKTIETLNKKDILFGVAFVNDIIASKLHAPDENDEVLINNLINQIKKITEIAGIDSIALGPDFFAFDYFSQTFNVPLCIPDVLFHDIGYNLIKTNLSRDGFYKDKIDSLFYKNATGFLSIG
jgi:microsomal dipeptidase-like Zn-dependent dipeptidase